MKEEYRKLKSLYQQKEDSKYPEEVKEKKEDSLLLNNKDENPEFSHEANKEIIRLKELISQIENEKESLRLRS